MASITVDVDVYLDEFNDSELVDELELRGYQVSKELKHCLVDEFNDSELVDELELRGYQVSKELNHCLDREDWQFLIEMLDKMPETWYTRRVRDKLLEARFG